MHLKFLVEHIKSQSCETCGIQATELVNDTEECEPDVVLGQAYLSSRLLGTHYFCKAHVRKPKIKPFFADLESRKDWLQTHGVQVFGKD